MDWNISWFEFFLSYQDNSRYVLECIKWEYIYHKIALNTVIVLTFRNLPNLWEETLTYAFFNWRQSRYNNHFYVQKIITLPKRENRILMEILSWNMSNATDWHTLLEIMWTIKNIKQIVVVLLLENGSSPSLRSR